MAGRITTAIQRYHDNLLLPMSHSAVLEQAKRPSADEGFESFKAKGGPL